MRVLVTGAARAIGRATVEVLAARGHEVVATARNADLLKGLPAAQILLAWEPRQATSSVLENAAFTPAALAGVRKRGWAQSVAERERFALFLSGYDLPLEEQRRWRV